MFHRLSFGQRELIREALAFTLIHSEDLTPSQRRSATTLVTRGIFSFDNLDNVYDLTSAAHSAIVREIESQGELQWLR